MTAWNSGLGGMQADADAPAELELGTCTSHVTWPPPHSSVLPSLMVLHVVVLLCDVVFVEVSVSAVFFFFSCLCVIVRGRIRADALHNITAYESETCCMCCTELNFHLSLA